MASKPAKPKPGWFVVSPDGRPLCVFATVEDATNVLVGGKRVMYYVPKPEPKKRRARK